MAEIIDLPDGQQITEPGAYRCSMKHYHGQQICPGPSISSSGLRKIWSEGPWAFWSQSELNPNRYPPKEPSPALILGRAAHSLILGDEVFSEAFTYYPKDAPRRPTATQIAAYERTGKWSDAAKEGAEFWEKFDAEAQGRTLLSEEQVEAVLRMAENIQRNPLAKQMLTGGLPEISLIWQDEATGIWVKSRPDMLPDEADAADLKTFSARGSNKKLAVQRAITDHGYHSQMALAQEGVERVFGMAASEFVLVFSETIIPHEVIPVRLDEESLHIGRIQNRHALDTFARCMKSGDWPGVVEGVLDYTVPPSIAGRIYDLQANGELPMVERLTA